MKSKDILTVHREKKSTYSHITILKDCNNKVKAILTGYKAQPKKCCKTLVLRGKTYNLDFSNC
jgi:prolyl-tRNA editing enzyme YbaK/EbsC (Cys-tRNA(Pro) deacylase)